MYDKIYHQSYYLKNRERIAKRKKLQWKQQREIRVKMWLKLKLEVFSHYSGGQPRCKCCGEKVIEFLTIDHINGGGRKHIKSVRELRGGYVFYTWLKKNNYPKGFQILCYNCNCGKRSKKSCPHKNQKHGRKRIPR